MDSGGETKTWVSARRLKYCLVLTNGHLQTCMAKVTGCHPPTPNSWPTFPFTFHYFSLSDTPPPWRHHSIRLPFCNVSVFPFWPVSAPAPYRQVGCTSTTTLKNKYCSVALLGCCSLCFGSHSHRLLGTMGGFNGDSTSPSPGPCGCVIWW